MAAFDDVIRRQAGVVSLRQALAAGVGESQLSGRVARGEWQRVFPGVYATFSGQIPWLARAHGAVLYSGRQAALGFEAAAYLLHLEQSPPRVLDVCIPRGRKVREQPGVRIHRRKELRAHGLPRRTSLEVTVFDLVGRAGTADEVVGIVTTAARKGVDPAFMVDLLQGRARQRWRPLLTDMFTEPGEGIESPLEYRYHHDVERRHGLPRAELQHRQLLGFSEIRADVRYATYSTRVELDGRIAHADRADDDLWRDNEVAIPSGELTLRYRWPHVAGTPCRTADQVARAVQARGWAGQPFRCGPTCQL